MIDNSAILSQLRNGFSACTFLLKKGMFFLFAFCGTLVLFGQNNDFQIWTGIDLDKQISKKIDIEYGTQWRISDNASRLDNWYNQLELSYKYKKHVKLSSDIRFGTSSKEDSWRYGVAIAYDRNLLWFKASLKTQVQFSHNSLGFDLLNEEWKRSFRTRLNLDYKLNKRTNILLRTEPIFDIDNSIQLRRIRSGLILKRRIMKRLWSNTGFLIQNRFSPKGIFVKSDYILNFGLNYEL